MPRRTAISDTANMLHLEGDDRARYLAMQRKRAQRNRDKSRFEEVTVKVPRHRADEIRALARRWCEAEEP